ncbi:putative histidine kinase/HSP90-like ATPase superfamily, morc, S5 domain 2 [Helianthus debilis subsp. tardiflorus]
MKQLGTNSSESSKPTNNSEAPVIDLDSSDDENMKKGGDDVVLPGGFLDPLPPKYAAQKCKNFWKAGDFEQGYDGNWDTLSGGMDHVRVHPRFLHSNATSHKWVLGAFAELLDNSLDEVCNGATYVNIDMLRNKKDGNKMLLIEDNGGGMDPDKMRQCMSLGYSLKSKVADTIGQYGNGFKTSTMRLGADVIVFSRCSAKDGKSSTQSIGLLSYTFLRSTGKEDIIVPMLDYQKDGREWKKIIRSSPADWNTNADAVFQWSPFSSEASLLKQFDHIKDQGTRIIIYNLWDDDQGQLELDFEADEEDIQIRGVNRDEKNIRMANIYPNCKHYLTYKHSLRSYASILYLRIPPGFRMILRGKDIQHHNIVNDMMIVNEITYRPQPGADKVSQDSNIVAVVTMGFVKDARAHIDVQGYNVYHKNRLIKPFWRLWNVAGSSGRGVIGHVSSLKSRMRYANTCVLEANFVEPAHDKQGFERTIVLSRLEARLIQMQKNYWRAHCHKIGYSGYPQPVNKKLKSTPLTENVADDDLQTTPNLRHTNGSYHIEKSAKECTPKDTSRSAHAANAEAVHDYSPNGKTAQIVIGTQSRFPVVGENESTPINSGTPDLHQLMEENRKLKEMLEKNDEDVVGDLLHNLQRQRNQRVNLEAQVEEVKENFENLYKVQLSMIDEFAEERERREVEQASLTNKLKDETAKKQDLVKRVKQLELEKMKSNEWSAIS